MSIKIIWTQEKKDKAIEKLTEYYQKYGIGEMIHQNDDALIEAPEYLGDIADDILIYREGIIFEDDDDI